MTRRKHTRVVWVVRRSACQMAPDREYDTRAKARAQRAKDRARGIAGGVERVVLRRRT